MRPIADTAVASIVNMPAADCSSWPQWIVCQSVAQPSTAEYWHIGETTMRFANVSSRSENSENSDSAMMLERIVRRSLCQKSWAPWDRTRRNNSDGGRSNEFFDTFQEAIMATPSAVFDSLSADDQQRQLRR